MKCEVCDKEIERDLLLRKLLHQCEGKDETGSHLSGDVDSRNLNRRSDDDARDDVD